MKENGLVSSYTLAQYQVYTTNCNESPILNIVDRELDNREKLLNMQQGLGKIPS